MYLKNEHFDEIMAEKFGNDFAQIFDHSERLSSKARLYSSGANLAIVYINTIVFLQLDGKIKVNTDGWQTVTSKKWINYGFNLVGKKAYIYQKQWNWYINENGDERDYQDNLILSPVNA